MREEGNDVYTRTRAKKGIVYCNIKSLLIPWYNTVFSKVNPDDQFTPINRNQSNLSLLQWVSETLPLSDAHLLLSCKITEISCVDVTSIEN